MEGPRSQRRVLEIGFVRSRPRAREESRWNDAGLNGAGWNPKISSKSQIKIKKRKTKKRKTHKKQKKKNKNKQQTLVPKGTWLDAATS